MKIGVLGTGSWGTALGQVLCDNGHEVLLYGVSADEIDDLNEHHRNAKYFGDVPVSECVCGTTDVGRLAEYNDALLIAVPTHFITDVLQTVAGFVRPDTILINASKGFEWTTNRRISETIRETYRDLPYAGVAFLIGPSHAEEVILRMLTSVCAVSPDISLAEKVQTIFSNNYLRVYVSDDEIGAEYGVAMKNVIAIASGILEGQGYGDNAKAALITRGLREMVRYGTYKGGRRDTFFGLTGVGDLIVTCFSPHSRNYQAGLQIGRANSASVLATNKQTVEGVHSCKSVHEDAAENGIEMPIIDGIYRVIFDGAEPCEVIRSLMNRPLKAEE